MTNRRTSPLSRSLLPGTRLEDCVLRVIEGPDAGREVRVEPGELKIGADPRCELVLSDSTVSAVHAEVTLTGEGIRFRDVGSTNGIHFLGTRISDAVLQPGSVITLGKSVLAILPPSPGELSPLDQTSYGALLGHGLGMQRLFAHLRLIEGSEITVLIEGETGSGKTAVAETLHERSDRQGPLVCVDCAAISAELIQSELFGHRRGAFTGAVADRRGAISEAHTGTLVLDQIGDLPLQLQPILLRFLETHRVQAVGAANAAPVDVRVIATTTRPLEREMRQGCFRADLFYRLSVGPVRIPPLREHPEDILPLARRFLAEIGGDQQLTPAQVAMLQSYTWPGNVRQLHNAVVQLVTFGSPFADGAADTAEPADFHNAKARMVERFERGYLEQLMREQRGNLSAASRVSGVARNHLRALLRRHGIDAERFRRG
jgi:DNA-binding NtrC family response regulator